MLYPGLLALIPIQWMILGILCHLGNTVLSIKLSSKIWKSGSAPLVTGALVGFNPVLLHFAFDPLDAALAITLFLAGPYLLAISRANDEISVTKVGAAGLCLDLAALARPPFFAVLLSLCCLSHGAAFFLQ